MLARHAMTLAPAVAEGDASIAYAAELMREWDTGIIPVVSSRASMRLVGVLTDRDIVTRCVAVHHVGGCNVSSHMSTEHLVIVHPDTTLEACARMMREAQVRRLPVVDGTGRLLGIVSLADVARKLSATDPLAVATLVTAISQPAPVHA